ncbi:unnamed protein product [Bursaphelenchus xylophilus]|uniref:(pine wood nematode) hypothetical protein n=1 Tax=Bursaphelenchus xylophilus TaxID=6326 RepID=A0A1I7S3B2_BURXY|nr:unnamed protein product [Bursaphelenchus xylophilus]CAG9116186.1 unnamed protein product [Bursaphelenchus xylophilus]
MGYFVTFPAIPDETPENNVFLANIAQNADWPSLRTATAKEMYEGTIRLLMEHGATVMEHLQLLEKDKELPRTFENVMDPLLTELYEIDYAFNTLLVKMLTDWPECSTRAFDMDFDHMKVMVAREHMEKLSDPEFQKSLQAIYDNGQDLDVWKTRLVEFFLLEIKASGLDKTDSKIRSIIGSWSKMIDEYRTKYLTNILCTNDQFVFHLNENQLRDAPPHILRQLSANKTTEGPWRAQMEPSSIYSLLSYCNDRPIRAQAWDRWVSRASFEHDFYNNSVNIEEIRHNAEGLAKTLGYSSVSEHRLANKMAGSPDTVRNFINELTHRMRPVFIDRMDAWQRYAAVKEIITGQLQPFDLFYICRKEALEHYSVDPLALMKYFPFWGTFNNLTQMLQYLLKIKFVDISDQDLQRCHPSCRIFSVADTFTGEHLGRIYIDPFAREGKRGKWNTFLGRTANVERNLDKIVYMIGNAEEAVNGQESLLHYSQLQQLLFHVGRAVQMLLSKSPYREITIPTAPMYASDWDAADLLPKFVEFFIYKPNMVAALSCPNVETGEVLTDENCNNVSWALQRGMLWESYRTLFWSDFDLTIFEMEDRKKGFWLDVYRKMYKDYFPFVREKTNYQPCSFTPIFAMPPYMSLYYRKLWAEMLALDVHETFNHEQQEEVTGERLKTTILYPGASELQGELYRRFQGRDPSVGAICDFYDPPAIDLSEEEKGF